METGKTLRGSANLAFDAAEGVTNIVEGMYRNIAATPWPLGAAPQGRAPGIAGFVHESIRKVTGVTRGSVDRVLETLSPALDRTLPPGPYREAILSALNGVCGDHLARSDNGLAIRMRMRVFLPAGDEAGTATTQEHVAHTAPDEKRPLLADLFETRRRPVEIYPQPTALTDPGFEPGTRLLIMLHGMSMSDTQWTSHQHNHAETLAENHGYTPVYLHYNSGRHISSNGRELSDQLQGLVEAWPVAVESITFIGFSMGGLLTRSALHCAQEAGHGWLQKVARVVYLGTPHHGAVMERGGFWLQKSLTYSPYTAPLAVLGRIRSDGITDLRHGNVQDDDWQHHDEHEENADLRQPSPLPEGIEHYTIAATLSKNSGMRIGRLLGDGLVHPSSATGRHDNPAHDLAFPQDRTKIFYDLGHLGMLHDGRVAAALDDWLAQAE